MSAVRPRRSSVKEAHHLRNMLALLLAKLKDDKFHWDLDHRKLWTTSAPGVTWDDENTEWPTIYLNDGVRGSWSTVSQDDLVELLFHELTHLAGSEDDDSEGLLGNAHNIDDMINGSFTGNSIWRNKILLGTPLNLWAAHRR